MEYFIDKIISRGGTIYLVGGINRDRLFNYYHNTNHVPRDYDILVLKLPCVDLINILSKFGKINEVGKSFGVLKFRDSLTDILFDIALPRTEISTGPDHKDFEITVDQNIPLELDLTRRDSTMNSIAQNFFYFKKNLIAKIIAWKLK